MTTAYDITQNPSPHPCIHCFTFYISLQLKKNIHT